MNDDWNTMTEEEKYAEWSIYVGWATTHPLPIAHQDYSEYCDWMDAWEASRV